MSQVATFTICENNQQLFFSSRHDGLYLDRALLQGPGSFVSFARKCMQLEYPCLEPQLSGYAEVDLDQHRLRYWGSQGFGFDAVSQRMYRALLQTQWPGWQLEWLYEPAVSLNCAGLVMSRCDWTASEVKAMQSEAWETWKQSSRSDIQKYGEDAARAKVETMWNGFATWITVRTEEGVRDALLYNQCWPEQSILLLGMELLEVLAVRPTKSLNDEDFVESEIKICCLLDLVEHRFFWWAKERTLTVFNLQDVWPGWDVQVLADGPTTQLELTGRPPFSLLSTVCLQKMEGTWLAELLGLEKKSVDVMSKEQACRAAKPAIKDEHSPQRSSWESQIIARYHQMLRTPAFQAQKMNRYMKI